MLKNAFFLAVICAFLGGLTPVGAKIALETIPPLTLVFLRFLTASLFLLPFIIYSKELSIEKLKQLAGTGLVGALNPTLLFLALPFTQASVSPLIYASVPALTAVYLFVSAGRCISKMQTIGIIIGFLGVSLVIVTPLLERNLPPSAFAGNVLILGAAIAFMFYGILSKKYQQHHKVSPLALTFYFCVITAVVMIPLMIFELATVAGGVQQVLAQTTTRQLLGALATGTLGSGMFYLMYQWAIAHGSEVAANVFTYLQPISTILLAVLFLGESIGPAFIVGGVLAVIGATMAKG